MTTAAVVLAAGGGARYTTSGGKGHKLLAPFMGWNVVGWSILSAVSAKLDATYVVVGAVEIPRIDGVRYVSHCLGYPRELGTMPGVEVGRPRPVWPLAALGDG